MATSKVTKKSKTKILIALLLGVVAIEAIFLLSQGTLRHAFRQIVGISKTYTIVLTEEGFVPSDLKIVKGDTVVFKSELDREYWPASDPHPVHDRFPDFDPGRALSPDEEWSFTFERNGLWNFHDHLSESYRGKIEVGFGNDIDIDNCSQMDQSKQEQCWDELIVNEIREKGIDEAFELFTYLYATEPSFVSIGCHWTSHSIGEEAYRMFVEGEDFELTPATAYCGYGFYHGFMTLLLRDNPDMDNAREFCDYVDKKLSKDIPVARLNCYHGIGHGFIEDPPDPRFWGDAEAMLAGAKAVCGDVSDNVDEVAECYEGAYNGLVLLMEADLYDFTLDKEDPLGFCFTQPEELRGYCLYEFSQKLDFISEWDVMNVLDFMTQVTDEEQRKMVIRVATAAMMQRDIVNDDNTHYIHECRKLPSNLQDDCTIGIVIGFIAHGEPGREYEKAITHCSSEIMTDHEREVCMKRLLERIQDIYTREKVETICESVDVRFAKYCEPYRI